LIGAAFLAAELARRLWKQKTSPLDQSAEQARRLKRFRINSQPETSASAQRKRVVLTERKLDRLAALPPAQRKRVILLVR
jgi:hypothetical protein